MDAVSRIKAKYGIRSTPTNSNTSQRISTGNKQISPVVSVEKKQKLLFHIIEAIKAIGHPRKGASYQAIVKWIINLRQNESNHFKAMLKLALIKGLSTGEIVRPSHCLTAVGATGSFMLPKKITKKSPKKLVKPLRKTTSTQKEKTQTQEKPNVKKVLKTTSKATTKKQAASKKRISEKDKPVAKMDRSKPKTEMPVGLKKRDKTEKNTKDKSKKDKKSTKNSKDTVNKEAILEENAETIKQPNNKAGPSKQRDLNKKAISKAVIGKTSKAAGIKKPYSSKKVPSQKRNDLSDTELEISAHHPIPLKSYSSDTEFEVSKRKDLNNKINTKSKERKIPGKRNMKNSDS